MKTRLMLVAAFAAVTFAQPGPLPGRGPGGPGPNVEQPRTSDALKTALSLTDAQVTSLTTLQQQKHSQLQTIRQQIAEKQQAIHTALQNDNPDANAIAALLVQSAALQKQAKSIGSGYQSQALAILTDAQKTKLKDLENAQSLQRAVREAEGMDLLTRPEGEGPGFGPGPGGMGPGGMRGSGMGPMGLGFRSPTRPPAANSFRPRQ
jgi:Spy/CpxP family protein refolding chaperone